MDTLKNQKILIIGSVWPEPYSSAAGVRTYNLIETFLNKNGEVHFASASKQGYASENLTQAFKKKPFKLHCLTLNDSSFDTFITTLKPDYAIFDRFISEEQFGWKVEKHAPQCIRIIDTQDLHFLRKKREEHLLKRDSKPIDFKVDPYSHLILREIASFYRSDGSLILSDFEFYLLTRYFKIPKKLLFLSRFHYQENFKNIPLFEKRQDFMMIGNLRHTPNIDGIFWFHSEIWPRIKHLFKTKTPTLSRAPQFFLYGAYPPKKIMQLHDKKIGFHILGEASDSIETLKKYRINLAPLRFGAGIKGKITDGWAAGTPVIATPIGVEGMHGSMPWAGEIAHSAEEFAEKAYTLYCNKTLWDEAQKQGFKIISKLYAASKNEVKLVRYLCTIKEKIEERRQENFIGALLRHHQHQSTKYFSKWIEEKEKSLKGLKKTESLLGKT